MLNEGLYNDEEEKVKGEWGRRGGLCGAKVLEQKKHEAMECNTRIPADILRLEQPSWPVATEYRSGPGRSGR